MGWNGIYLLLVLMFFTVLWPQPSYIHPDEFFQSTEIVAGDIFNIAHLRTWEFQENGAPIRDITLPYLLYAPGYHLLKTALHYMPALSSYISESYLLIIIPRLVITFAGLANVHLIIKLCERFNMDRCRAVWFWLSSYVVWTFLTRSFSNTVETMLFSAIVLLIVDLRSCLNKILPGQKNFNTAVEEADPEYPKACHKLKYGSFLLGVVLSAGVFNRPTFLFFAFVPLLWWLEQVFCHNIWSRHVLASLSLFICGMLSSAWIMAVGNSLYYNHDFYNLLNDLSMAVLEKNLHMVVKSATSLVWAMKVPPWNFIQFNLAAKNLAQHGLHPWYSHFCINLPLLIGPLFLLISFDLLKLVIHCRRREREDVLYAMVVVPVILLSIFPHQEARFLLPVLPVAFVCAVKNPLSGCKAFQIVVIIFNMTAFVAYGWLHQGGVVPAMSQLQHHLKMLSISPASEGEHFVIISYSSYMLPRHLLFHRRDSSVEINVDDLLTGQNHLPILHAKLVAAFAGCEKSAKKCRYYVLASGPAVADLSSLPGFSVKEEAEYCPHVSGERLPTNITLIDLWTLNGWRKLCSQLCLKLISVTV